MRIFWENFKNHFFGSNFYKLTNKILSWKCPNYLKIMQRHMSRNVFCVFFTESFKKKKRFCKKVPEVWAKKYFSWFSPKIPKWFCGSLPFQKCNTFTYVMVIDQKLHQSINFTISRLTLALRVLTGTSMSAEAVIVYPRKKGPQWCCALPQILFWWRIVYLNNINVTTYSCHFAKKQGFISWDHQSKVLTQLQILLRFYLWSKSGIKALHLQFQ